MASFKLRYSPLFYQDLDAITDYILLELNDKPAAQKFVDDVEMAIQKRLRRPLQAAPYHSLQRRRHEYRRILVGNFLIFYVVIEDVMVVRRLLYGRGDLDRIL